METRILKRKEFGRLGSDKKALFESLPKETKVVIVEQNGEIVGHCVLIPYWHFECFEVREDHKRKAGVVRGLLRRVFSITNSLGLKTVLTASVTDEVENYLARLQAVELPGKHYILPVGKGN